MEIVNFLRQPAQIESVHGGEGLCRNCRVLGPESFDTPVLTIPFCRPARLLANTRMEMTMKSIWSWRAAACIA